MEIIVENMFLPLVKCVVVESHAQHMEVFIHRLELHSTQPVGFPTLHGVVIYLCASIHFGIRPVSLGSLSALTTGTAASQQQQRLLQERSHMNNHPDAAR